MAKRMMGFRNIYMSGVIGKRAEMLLQRFAEDDFRAGSEKTFRDKEYEWPGDNEGRLLLALVLLARCTHKPPKYFDEIMEKLPSYLNEKGYFGPVMDKAVYEQQIAGNSWFLRSLLEYYKWKGKEETYCQIQEVLENFLYPLAEIADTYPFSEKVSSYKGKAEGCQIPVPFGNWYMSTDFGCFYIMLDGAAQAYDMWPDERLKKLIEIMIDSYLKIDIRGLHFQTHATLSCIRGILRFYEKTREMKYLEIVKRYYGYYLEEGMTANYSNYNWFGIPDWTEPCAVVDSFQLATALWKETGEERYLNQAHYIMYNGIFHGQRSNGGFGCDNCAGAGSDFLFPIEENYEAWWCCSKRGAEFFSTVTKHLYLTEEHTLYIPFYEDSCATLPFSDGKLVINQTAAYPYGETVAFEILKTETSEEKTFCFFVPEYINDGQVMLLLNEESCDVKIQGGMVRISFYPEKGDRIVLKMELSKRAVKAFGKHTLENRYLMMQGPMCLSLRMDAGALPVALPPLNKLEALEMGTYRDPMNGNLFSPSGNSSFLSQSEMLSTKEQITFREGL